MWERKREGSGEQLLEELQFENALNNPSARIERFELLLCSFFRKGYRLFIMPEILSSSRKEITQTAQLLVIIVDASPAQKYVRDDPSALFKVVDALVAFGNAHVLLSNMNQVAFYASTINDWYVEI